MSNGGRRAQRDGGREQLQKARSRLGEGMKKRKVGTAEGGRSTSRHWGGGRSCLARGGGGGRVGIVATWWRRSGRRQGGDGRHDGEGRR